MATLEGIKHRLIDKISASTNEELLEALEKIITSTQKEEILSFSPGQIEMLRMSEQDIENGNLVSEAELDKLDKQWLG